VDFKSSSAHVKIFPLATRALACSQGPLQSGDIPNTCGLHGFSPVNQSAVERKEVALGHGA